MMENKSTIESLQSQISVKNDELEKLIEKSNPDAEVELIQAKEKLSKLLEQISLRESEMENLKAEKAVLETKTVDLEKANQKLTGDVELLRKGWFNLHKEKILRKKYVV
jgi:hypothetical protein